MGADHRLFPGPWKDLPGFVAHDWPTHKDERTISALACRVVEEFQIADGDVMIGASLGGMVACEVARTRHLRGVFLIGSATSCREINQLILALEPLAKSLPSALCNSRLAVFLRNWRKCSQKHNQPFFEVCALRLFSGAECLQLTLQCFACTDVQIGSFLRQKMLTYFLVVVI